MSTEIEPTPAAPDGELGSIAAQAAGTGAAEVIAGSLGEYARIWWARVRGGESGALPVLLALAAIVIYFDVRSSVFLSAGNLYNLLTQAGWIITLGMAEVFVLLLGEIDLSVGFSAAMGAVVAAWMVSPTEHLPWWLAVLAALVVPAAFSAIQGVLFTWLRAPSFVITLGGLLMGQGLLILLVDSAAPNAGGSLQLSSNVLNDVDGGWMTPTAGWVITAISVVLGAAFFLYRDTRRRSSGLAAPPLSVTVLKIAAMAVAGVVLVILGNQNRGRTTVVEGLPWVVLILLVVLIAWSVLLGRTRFGRYVYAIGGNAEAARRAGVNLSRVRVLAFALCGLTAGISGIIYASNLGSIGNNVNGGQNVLYAVAAGVIGGTSLFGGRGKMLGAVLGGLIVAVIYNGLYLLGLGPAAVNMWTAAVLLGAVAVDTLARRRTPGSR